MKNISKYAMWHLLHFYFKTLLVARSDVASAIFFVLMALTTFYMSGLSVGAGAAHSVMGVVLNIIILSSILLCDTILRQDRREGISELLHLSGLGAYWIICMHLVMMLTIVFVISVVTTAAGALMFGLELSMFKRLLIVVLSVLLPLVVVLLFVSLITGYYEGKLAQYILALPLLVPLLILAVGSISNAHYLTMCVGVNFVYVPVFLWLSSMVVREFH